MPIYIPKLGPFNVKIVTVTDRILITLSKITWFYIAFKFVPLKIMLYRQYVLKIN